MKTTLITALLIPVAFAQAPLDCSRARYCEMREQATTATGRFSVEDLHNGSVTVRGANRSDVLVRMRVESDAHSDREAKDLFSRIHTHVMPGRFSVDGPSLEGLFDWIFGTGWTVSVEVLVPNKTELRLTTHNGPIQVVDIGGRVQVESHNGAIRLTNVTGDARFESHNGAVTLTRMGGSVEGGSHNGGVEVELSGSSSTSRVVRVDSHNGGVHVAVPGSFSAHVIADTHNGGFRSDFPSASGGRDRDGHREFDLGSGGGTIRISTRNGGIRLGKA